MIAISAVDKNWAIGNQGKLLISLPEDQKGVFKKYTAGLALVVITIFIYLIYQIRRRMLFLIHHVQIDKIRI